MANVSVKVDEVADIVNIAPSTVRKYAGLIEAQGYRFERSNQNALMFNNNEINMLREMVETKKHKGVSLAYAVEHVLKDRAGVFDTSDTDDMPNTAERNMANIDAMPAILSAMSDMQKQMNAILEQNAEILAQNRELIEQNKLLQAPPAEETPTEKSEPEIEQPKKKRWQFWK